MTKDRTEQLKAELAKDSKRSRYTFWPKEEKMEEGNDEERVALTGVTVQPSITKAGKKEQDALKSIFKEVSQINEWIEQMKEYIGVLRTCQVIVQQSTRTESSMKDKIQDLMSSIKATSIKVKTSLQALEKQKQEEGSAINRVVETQHSLLRKAYIDVIDDYQQSLVLHKKICEDIIKKQLMIADKDVTQEELGAILDTEDIAVFVDNYMKEMLDAKLVLQDAQDMHKEIVAIEKEICLIHELFTDLSMHVSRQGELIDRIEYHINDGTEKTHKGAKQLSRVDKLIKKVRKKKMWCIIILLIIVLFLILIGLIV